MPRIHPTAIVHKSANIDEDVEIGPFCFIDGNVTIGKGTILKQNVVVEGNTTIGENCIIYHGATIGIEPQDLKYKGEPSSVKIGNNVKIREFVTIHRGTTGGGMITQIGDNSLLMAYSHIAHDCFIGSNAILANAVTLAGHVEIGEYAVIGGLTGIHQFVRIGKHAMIGGASGVDRDVPPFTVAKGNRAKLEGINIVGLRRRHFPKEMIKTLTIAFNMLFKTNEPLSASVSKVREKFSDIEHIKELTDFITNSKRGICQVQGGNNDV